MFRLWKREKYLSFANKLRFVECMRARYLMKSEQTIQSEIIIEINKRGHRLWRSNAGRVVTKDNRVIQLMPKGFPDTVGFRKTDGKFIVIEIKTVKGKLRPEQEKFKTFIETQPVIYGVARSVNDAIKIIEGDSDE